MCSSMMLCWPKGKLVDLSTSVLWMIFSFLLFPSSSFFLIALMFWKYIFGRIFFFYQRTYNNKSRCTTVEKFTKKKISFLMQCESSKRTHLQWPIVGKSKSVDLCDKNIALKHCCMLKARGCIGVAYILWSRLSFKTYTSSEGMWMRIFSLIFSVFARKSTKISIHLYHHRIEWTYPVYA